MHPTIYMMTKFSPSIGQKALVFLEMAQVEHGITQTAIGQKKDEKLLNVHSIKMILVQVGIKIFS